MITFKNVTVKYDKNYALKEFSTTINDGEFVFLVGATGAGKTTIVKLLTRELIPNLGQIIVFNNRLLDIKNSKVPYYRRNLGIIFQDFKLLSDRNVYENVAFAQEVIGVNKQIIKKHVMQVLNIVGIRNKSQKKISELSGGERQKVAIARAIVNKPKIIIADEPTGNLDEISTNEIIDILMNINNMGTTVLMITHDLHLVSRMNKRVIRIHQGELVSDTIGLDDKLKLLLKNNEYLE